MTTMDATRAARATAPRPFAVGPKRSDVLDVLVRTAVVQTYAHVHKMSIEDARLYLADHYARYGDEVTKAFCDYAAKGISVPATTYLSGWAAELVGQSHADVIGALLPRSGYAQLAALGLSLQFGRNGRIAVPSFSPSVAGAFVREGEPIPVAQGETTGEFLTRKKMAVITTFTSEIDEASVPTIESLLRARIQESSSIVLDSVLFDDEPASDVRPAGLLHGAVELGSSGGMQGDLQSLAEGVFAAASNHVRSFVMIANPAQALAARLQNYRDVCPLIVSSAVPPGTVIMLDAADFVCAGGDAPRFEISGQATLHMEDTTPNHLANGGQASPTRSLWQTNTRGLRMILQVDWCLRRPSAVAFMSDVFWQSGGGGGTSPRARTTLTAPLSMPSPDGTVVAEVENADQFAIGQQVWVEPLGYFEVADKSE
jgi:hypothetical protein